MADYPHRYVDAIDAAPRAAGFDQSLAFLAEGYEFMPRRYVALGSDMFAARLMLRRALCVRGEDAARMFYQPGRFTRRHALPAPTMALLQDFGSVMALDGEAHRKRKAMLMSLFGPLERQRLVGLAADQAGDGIAVQPAPYERFQNQNIQSASHQFELVFVHGLPLLFQGEVSHMSPWNTRGAFQ